MDRIDLFRIFVRIVDGGSFTRAADMLGLPRSSVSAAVHALETRLGTRLLHRTTRRVTLTQDSAVFHERCLRLLADVAEAENLFREAEVGPAGTLCVDVPARIGRLVIAPALPDFLERYPGIELRLGMTDRAVNLAEDGVDCVLRVGPLGDSELIARWLGDLPILNVASRDYVRRHGRPACPADLDAHLAVHYASPTSGRVEAWEWVEEGELHARSMRGRVTVNGAEAYIACCLAGLGMIQVPGYDVAAQLASGELVELLPDHRARPMPLTLLHPHRRHLSRRLQVFADWLAALVGTTLLAPTRAVHR